MAQSLGIADAKLIDFHALLSTRKTWPLFRGLAGPIEYLLSINKLNQIHRHSPPNTAMGDFCRYVLSKLNVDYALTEPELQSIPTNGPLVMVANHPFGGIEGIILAEVLLQARPDVRILGNYLLSRIPALASHIIPVDPFQPQQSARANARNLRQALRWVADGGALLTFPAGEVAHVRPGAPLVQDGPWSDHIASIIVKAKAKAMPVFIHGRNSVFFNLMGLIHPNLRTILLPREMVKKKDSLIELTLGRPIGWRQLAEFQSPTKAAEFLQFSTYFLKHRNLRKMKRTPVSITPRYNVKAQKPIIAPVLKNLLMNEIRALTPECHLLDHKMFSVYVTSATHSPAIMREIGRLREISFRDAGEGSGRSVDIDTFDAHYLQLFLWNHAGHEIAGAYRIGLADVILRQMGPTALYSNKLFNYKSPFYDRLNQALELGRSFIRVEYQKKFGCLSLLWRGIGEFVVRNPQYRHLFGPVSISQDYHTISRNLMVAFLSHHAMDPVLASLVHPRCRVKIRRSMKKSTSFFLPEKDAIEEISMLVSEVEKDNKGVPTLIKHYLKLNGQFLAFNLDKAFARVIDGLIWVDLLKTEPKLIDRFMSPAGAETFYRHHKPKPHFKAA